MCARKLIVQYTLENYLTINNDLPTASNACEHCYHFCLVRVNAHLTVYFESPTMKSYVKVSRLFGS